MASLTSLSVTGNALTGCTPPSYNSVVINALSLAGLRTCSPDRAALVALYNSTDGANWATSTNWLSDRPIGEWHGVTATSTGRVSHLDLESNDLEGTIPAELGSLSSLQELNLYRNELSGSIPAELGSLSNLQDLLLADNDLSGSIPSELGNLSSLQYLVLFQNDLSGAIPSELGNLSNLRTLSLYANDLTGMIPVELGNLSSLQILDIATNNLTGAMPPALGSLASLNTLNVTNNSLTGCLHPSYTSVVVSALRSVGIQRTCGSDESVLIDLYYATGGPNWTTATKWLSDRPIGEWHDVKTNSDGRVTRLLLADNNLSGTIPTELGNLSSLEILWLGDNDLSGSIPSELGSLSSLQDLSLGLNELSGTIPSELGNLSRLRKLWLFENDLSGAIPAELGRLGSLRLLDLSSNDLSGSIPAELGNLSNLVQLGLNDNELSGSIPAELGNLSNLKDMWLYENELSGMMPLAVGALPLDELWVWGNSLTGGCIPPFFTSGVANGLRSVGIRDCGPDEGALVALYHTANGANWTTATNWLSDRPIGEWYGVTTKAAGRVTELRLRSNNLSGTIPTELGSLSSLKVLDLGSNPLLVGCVPPDLWFIQTQRYYNLNGLQFCEHPDRAALVALYNATDGANWDTSTNWLSDRPIGTWHGVEWNSNQRVFRVRLADNGLEGTIPTELGNLSELRRLNLDRNQLSGTIPTELGNLSELRGLSLYSNQLSGTIPTELGNLSDLKILWLGANQLTGPIPSELGNLSNLVELTLYNNQLTGAIPSELGDLTNLERLEIDRNSLTGCIPASLRDVEGNLGGLPYCTP